MEPGELYRERIEARIDQLARIMSVRFTANPFRPLKKRFVLAASARTGSNLLCEGLMSHGVMARELFNINRIDDVRIREGFDGLQDYCEAMVKRFARLGVFGVKGALDVLAPLALAGEIPDHIADWRFVYLTRMDVVKQAISHFAAELSGSWRSNKEGVALTDNDYDQDRIAALVNKHITSNARWEDLFSAHRVRPFRITYEKLAEDVTGTCAAVAKFLDIDGDPIALTKKAPLAKQATSLNAVWEARFREASPARP